MVVVLDDGSLVPTGALSRHAMGKKSRGNVEQDMGSGVSIIRLVGPVGIAFGRRRRH